MVVTDATCFMKWIAEQYDLQLPPHYEKYLKKNPRCSQGTGNINDINREHCRYRRAMEDRQQRFNQPQFQDE